MAKTPLKKGQEATLLIIKHDPISRIYLEYTVGGRSGLVI